VAFSDKSHYLERSVQSSQGDTKLRAGEPLTDKERAIHKQGLVSVLRQIHDDLDAAVFDAYGWPRDLADDEILRRLGPVDVG
jgi:hypothetical protein